MSETPEQPGAPSPRRAQKKMTPEDKLKLDAILKRPDVRIDGKLHLPTVVTLTGLSYQQVYGFVRSNNYLAAQVKEINPSTILPNDGDLIDPPPAVVTISDAEFARAEALHRQQRKMLSADWVAQNMTQEEADRMERLGKIGRSPLLELTNVLNGGLIKLVIGMHGFLENDLVKIQKQSLPPEVDKEGVPVEDGKIQRDWRQTFYNGVRILNEVQKSMFQNQAMLLKSAKEMKALGGGDKPPEKGVFEMPALSERAAE